MTDEQWEQKVAELRSIVKEARAQRAIPRGYARRYGSQAIEDSEEQARLVDQVTKLVAGMRIERLEALIEELSGEEPTGGAQPPATAKRQPQTERERQRQQLAMRMGIAQPGPFVERRGHDLIFRVMTSEQASAHMRSRGIR